jgi:cytochrome b involved in lipid metabolism
MTEQIQLSLAVSTEAKTKLQSRIAEKRVDELVEVKNDLKADVKAQAQAETEANQAIQTLTEVKTQLEAKGNTTAASAINETILRLRTRLENPTEKKRMDKEDENKDFHNNSDEDENISNQRTTQDKPLVKVELKGQVVNQNGQLQISAGGKTYILANTITGTSLQSFVGKFVELKGVASGSMVTVTQIEAKDANEKSEAKEENERDDDDDDDDDDRGQNSNNQATSTPPANTSTNISLSQVLAANTSQKCWTIVGDTVYDLTAWINQHPGGKAAITGLCGKDGTASFVAQHGSQTKANQVLASYRIGILVK